MMPVFLNTRDPGFEAAFAALLGMKREEAEDVDAAVAAIIADVRSRGDAAVLELTAVHDRLRLTPETMAFSEGETDAAIATVSAEDRAALNLAADRIRAYHERQRPVDEMWEDATGARLGWRWTPVSAAGLYVPGGLASYPSSVLMNAIPARVAGVERLVICCPTPDGVVNPLVLLAARISGVDAVYRIGGAQAIAALAYGTATIPPVDKITGPGNAFVAAAKRRVFGRVGIDMIAGPSEILVIADRDNDPDWIALDLLSQAEHDASAQSILVTDDAAFGRPVQPRRPGTSGAVRGRPRGAGKVHHPRRGHLSGGLDARGDWRLCRRPQPCAAHRPLCPVFQRAVGAGFHEAHDAGAHDPGVACRDRPGGGTARPVGKPAGPCAQPAGAAGPAE